MKSAVRLLEIPPKLPAYVPDLQQGETLDPFPGETEFDKLELMRVWLPMLQRYLIRMRRRLSGGSMSAAPVDTRSVVEYDEPEVRRKHCPTWKAGNKTLRHQ